MSSWNFDIGKTTKSIIDDSDIKEKMKKIRKSKMQNKDPIFENIFEPNEKTHFKKIDSLDTTILKYNPIQLSAPRDPSRSIWSKTKLIEGMTSDDLSKKGINITDSNSNIVDAVNALSLSNPDSLTDIYNKISDQNKQLAEKKPPLDVLTLSQISEQVDAKKSNANALDLKNANFLFPNSTVADLPNRPASTEADGQGAGALLDSGKNFTDSINSKMTSSSETIAVSNKINALKGEMSGRSLKNPNNPIVSNTSPGASQTSKIKVAGLGDQLKKAMKKALDNLKRILFLVFEWIGKKIKLAGEKFKSFCLHFRDNFNYLVIVIANALTSNNASVPEIKVFSSEIMKFTTVLFTAVFLYNWYYLMFHMNPEDRLTIDITQSVLEPMPIVYAFFGPSLRVVELLDWVLLSKIPEYTRKVTGEEGKPLQFLFIAISFFMLVLSNFQTMVLTSFLNALSFNSTESILSIITSVVVFGYGAKFIFWDSGIFGKASQLSGMMAAFAIFGCLLLAIFYMLYISFFGVPFGVLGVNTYIFIYSFFAILLYSNKDGVGILKENVTGGMFGVANEIYKEVSPTTEELNGTTQEEEEPVEPATTAAGKLANAFRRLFGWIKSLEKYVKYINMYIVEIIIMLILILGIDTYTSQYGSIQFDKTTSKTVNSIGSPVRSAFHNLFTWLIIFNVLLILFIGVRMVAKYYRIKFPVVEES